MEGARFETWPPLPVQHDYIALTDAPDQVELPPDAVIHIALQVIAAGDATAMIFAMRRVCKSWHAGLSDDALWERVVREQFPSVMSILGGAVELHMRMGYFKMYAQLVSMWHRGYPPTSMHLRGHHATAARGPSWNVKQFDIREAVQASMTPPPTLPPPPPSAGRRRAGGAAAVASVPSTPGCLLDPTPSFRPSEDRNHGDHVGNKADPAGEGDIVGGAGYCRGPLLPGTEAGCRLGAPRDASDPPPSRALRRIYQHVDLHHAARLSSSLRRSGCDVSIVRAIGGADSVASLT